MAYRMTNAHRLQIEADRVQGLLEMRVFSGYEWEGPELIEELRKRGLEYTTPELVAIRDELIARNVIEVV